MTLIHLADQSDKACVATRALRKALDERTPADVDPARRVEFAAIAGDAAAEDRGLAAVDMAAEVAPLVLQNRQGRPVKYRVIRVEVRDRATCGESIEGEAAVEKLTVYRLLGPRGGISTMMENIRREGAEHVPLAYHLKDKTWHRVDRAAGTYTKIG